MPPERGGRLLSLRVDCRPRRRARGRFLGPPRGCRGPGRARRLWGLGPRGPRSFLLLPVPLPPLHGPWSAWAAPHGVSREEGPGTGPKALSGSASTAASNIPGRRRATHLNPALWPGLSSHLGPEKHASNSSSSRVG